MPEHQPLEAVDLLVPRALLQRLADLNYSCINSWRGHHNSDCPVGQATLLLQQPPAKGGSDA